MPGVSSLSGDSVATSEAQPNADKAEQRKLWLPSDMNTNAHEVRRSDRTEHREARLLAAQTLDANIRETVCLRGVVDKEKRLRFAQVQDALIDIRRARRVRRGLALYHRIQVSGDGQKANTKTQSVISGVRDRINKAIARYRAARSALLALDSQGDWQEKFLEFKDADNRGPGKEEDEVGTGDGHYSPSWIWVTQAASEQPRSTSSPVSAEEVNDTMRVDWATTHARADRWAEEVQLLNEEMRRSVVFLQWKSDWWRGQASSRASSVTPDIARGLNGYALKQAAVYRNLAVSCAEEWKPILCAHKLRYDWALPFAPDGAPRPATSALISQTPQVQSTRNSTLPKASEPLPSHIFSDEGSDDDDDVDTDFPAEFDEDDVDKDFEAADLDYNADDDVDYEEDIEWD